MEAKTAKTSLDVQWTMQSLQQSGGMPHCPIQQLILYFLPFDPFPLQAHIEYRGHLKKKRASQCCTDQWEVYADANHHWRGLHTMLHIALWHFFLIILFLPGWILLHPRIPVHVELCSSISMTVWQKEIHGFTAQPTHVHLVTHWTNILSEYVDNGVVWHVLHSFHFVQLPHPNFILLKHSGNCCSADGGHIGKCCVVSQDSVPNFPELYDIVCDHHINKSGFLDICENSASSSCRHQPMYPTYIVQQYKTQNTITNIFPNLQLM